jgi:hypothetical protein
MEPEAHLKRDTNEPRWAAFGAEESDDFCRNCGVSLRGEDLVRCPPCHQIVPGGNDCNQ